MLLNLKNLYQKLKQLHPSEPEKGEINSVTVNITSNTLKVSEAVADKEVGSISVDGGTEPYSYELTGTDADKFKIEEDKIKIKETLTEAKTYTAKVKVTDKNSKEKESDEFTIIVNQDEIKVSIPTGETSLNLGEKTVQELCENLSIDGTGKVTGALKHITNWTEFSKDSDENTGNFIPLYFEEAKGQPKGTIKCELKGTGAKLKKPVAVDSKDGLIVFQVHNVDNTIEITSEGKETRTLNLSQLDLKTD